MILCEASGEATFYGISNWLNIDLSEAQRRVNYKIRSWVPRGDLLRLDFIDTLMLRTPTPPTAASAGFGAELKSSLRSDLIIFLHVKEPSGGLPFSKPTSLSSS
jgi:hypothetical protein